jgi:hypothetical protein
MSLRHRSPLCVASAIVLPTALAVAVALAAHKQLADELAVAAAHAGQADRTLLALGISAFFLAPFCTGSAWCAALGATGGRLGLVDGCARYGVGSLVNSLTPLHLGECVRVALFARALPPGCARRGLASFGVLKLTRLAVLIGLAGIALHDVRLELLGLGGAIAALVLAQRRRAVRLVPLIAASAATRIAAVACVLASLGIGSPLTHACAIVPILAVAELLPLTPGNIGVASAAVAVSLRLSGVGLGEGVPVGIVMHGAETAGGISFGVCSALVLTGLHGGRRRLFASLSPRCRQHDAHAVTADSEAVRTGFADAALPAQRIHPVLSADAPRLFHPRRGPGRMPPARARSVHMIATRYSPHVHP